MRAADYGKPCGRQSDCAQCTVDHACTCTKIPNSNHSCCQPNGLAPHVDREPYAFGVPLDPNLRKCSRSLCVFCRSLKKKRLHSGDRERYLHELQGHRAHPNIFRCF